MRILIAEDDMTSRSILTVVLRKRGYAPIAVGNGTEAWEIMKKSDAPSLALLDWEMPSMDGLETCRRIRAFKLSNPPYLIILTSREEKADIVRGLDAGANDYISKPYNNDELLARLGVGARYITLQEQLLDRIKELEEAKKHINILQGMLPICMHCHKIRNDSDAWQKIDTYLENNTSVQVSHGLCEECLEKYYPEDGNDSEAKQIKLKL